MDEREGCLGAEFFHLEIGKGYDLRALCVYLSPRTFREMFFSRRDRKGKVTQRSQRGTFFVLFGCVSLRALCEKCFFHAEIARDMIFALFACISLRALCEKCFFSRRDRKGKVTQRPQRIYCSHSLRLSLSAHFAINVLFLQILPNKPKQSFAPGALGC